MQVASQLYQYCTGVLSDKFHPGTPHFAMAVYPVICYWIVATFYDVLDSIHHPAIERYRLTRKEQSRGNALTKRDVVIRVLLQHFMQFVVGIAATLLDPQQCEKNPPAGWLQSAVQFVTGMLVMDAWQYLIHRWMHMNTFLYKHVHSHHHQLVVPYAWGALYNHPLEALLLDTMGAVVTLYVSGMSCQVAQCFFSMATIKTVLDHCGYRFPVNPLHDVFPNSAAYHDVHHDWHGIKKNFSQPFFTYLDVLLGTYLDPEGFHLSLAEQTEQSQKQQCQEPKQEKKDQ